MLLYLHIGPSAFLSTGGAPSRLSQAPTGRTCCGSPGSTSGRWTSGQGGAAGCRSRHGLHHGRRRGGSEEDGPGLLSQLPRRHMRPRRAAVADVVQALLRAAAVRVRGSSQQRLNRPQHDPGGPRVLQEATERRRRVACVRAQKLLPDGDGVHAKGSARRLSVHVCRWYA